MSAASSPEQRTRAVWHEMATMTEGQKAYFAVAIMVELEVLAGRSDLPIRPEDLAQAAETTLTYARTATGLQPAGIVCTMVTGGGTTAP